MGELCEDNIKTAFEEHVSSENIYVYFDEPILIVFNDDTINLFPKNCQTSGSYSSISFNRSI